MKANILGQEYDIAEDSSIARTDGADGICHRWTHEIKILPAEEMLDYEDPEESKQKRYKEVLRHELIHAFFAESGLDNYCTDEVLVDWFARQFPKICRTFTEQDCMD